MTRLRDSIVVALIAAGVEAYLIIAFAPQFRPTGGLGRLGLRVFLANMALLMTWRWFIFPFFFNPLRKIPGPKGGNFLIGHGPVVFSKPPGAQFLKWVDEIPNDGLLRFRTFFNQDVLIPTTHETLKTVLSDSTYDYEKPSPITAILRRILGDGLILVEGPVHKFQRKHLLPSFQVKHIRELYPMFWAKASEMVNLLPDAAGKKEADGSFELEFGEYCARVTLDIIGIAGFGRDFGALKNPDDDLVRQYGEVLEPANEKLLWFALSVVLGQRLIGLIPWEINRKLTDIQNNLHAFALNMVKERRARFAKDKSSAESMNDILSLLVRSNDFDDAQLAEQVLTMMAAGHETTSSALSWCAYLLSLHPDVQRRVRDEVRNALPSPSAADQPLAAADIDALPLLNAVCLEVVRLYPTVPQTSRVAVNESRLGGHHIPKETQISLVPWAINRSKHFWGADANEFKPERWINADGTNNKTGGSSSNYAQLTFLHGPRSCIGQGFAQSELKCLLAAFVGRFEFSLAREGDFYFPAGLVTTKPSNGMWLKMKTVEGW